MYVDKYTKLFQGKYRVESTRLPNWDYSGNGWYFITICTKNMVNYFGEIRNFTMGLNEIGCITAKYLQEIPEHFKNVRIDEWVVMPNHVHVIVVIDKPHNVIPSVVAGGGGLVIGGMQIVQSTVETLHCNVSTVDLNYYSKISPKSGSLSTIIRSFKSIVTRMINHKYPHHNFQWQPRFYDHIIDSDKELYRIREYIFYNPQMWNRDRNNR